MSSGVNLKYLPKLQKYVPLAKYKGYRGKICIFGGCENYTGAPYYAAISALRTGADLAHVFCSNQNGLAMRSYSPELIIHDHLIESNLKFENDLEAFKASEEFKLLEDNLNLWLPRFSAFIGEGLENDF